MSDLSSNMPKIILNVNYLNILIKRLRMGDWINNKKSPKYCMVCKCYIDNIFMHCIVYICIYIYTYILYNTIYILLYNTIYTNNEYIYMNLK